MKKASVRVVFDRKKEATKKKTAIVQIEILQEGVRRYVSTGVKVYRDQWDDRDHVVNRVDRDEMNAAIDTMLVSVLRYAALCDETSTAISSEGIKAFLARKEESRQTVPEWIEERIRARTDIKESTRKTQRKLVPALRAFGGIVGFSDLTRRNIMLWDDWLRSKGLKQTSVWSYHKALKTYVHEAMQRELLQRDPYQGIKVDRGRPEWGRFLTADEVRQLENVCLDNDSLRHVRDLFLLQCYTGLAYSDLMAFDFRKVQRCREQYILSDVRKKTGMTYTVVLTRQALCIINRYGGELPSFSNQQYNMRLKIVAEAAGINKPVASHWGRRTCGMWLLNKGFPIEIVAKVLGHADIKTTQEAYARVLDETVVREFAKRMQE